MPRDASGVAYKPIDTTALPGTTAESQMFNRAINDLYAMFNGPAPVSAGGTGANSALAALTNLGALGISAALLQYLSVAAVQIFTDEQKQQARANISAAADSASFVVVGSVHWFPFTAAPAGYLKLNGTSIGNAASGSTGRANADTVALFTALWTNQTQAVCPVQAQDGSVSTRGASAAADYAANKRLVMHDARGEWIRSFSDGRAAVDTGRVLGSAQVEMIGPHNHTGVTNTTGEHTHGVKGGGGDGDPTAYRDGAGAVFNGTTSAEGDHTHTLTINNNSGTENRVRNVAFLCCIKY